MTNASIRDLILDAGGAAMNFSSALDGELKQRATTTTAAGRLGETRLEWVALPRRGGMIEVDVSCTR